MKKYYFLVGAVLAAFSLLTLILSMAAPVAAANSQSIFTVNSSTDATDVNPGDGICETGTGNGICTLRAAVMEANNFGGTDTILVPAGNYTITIPGNDDVSAVGDLDILESLEIVGDGAASTIIDGNAIDRIFHIIAPNNHTIMISDLTLQGGNANGGGGLCHCSSNSHVILSGTIVLDNNTPNQAGGGVRNFGKMTLVNTSIVSNTAEFSAGGLANEAGAVLTMTDSTIAYNIAEFDGLGGGISNKGILTIANSTIWRNAAFRLDGGSSGGGIYNSNSGQVWLGNSTVGENSVFSAGGGLFNGNSAAMTVTNSTIYSNSATSGANNIHVSGGTAKFHSSIVAGVNSNNCNGALISNGYNLEGGDSCGFSSTGDITNTNPLLGNIQDNGGPTLTYALLVGSPAIDVGNNATCPAVDQRGVSRPADGDGDGSAICDIGSYEAEFSDFSLVKNGPELSAAGDFITYTLMVTNNLSISVTNVILTDTIPANAFYISGGTQVGNVVSWTLPELEAGSSFSRSFVVTATQTITNDDYRVSASGSYSTTGSVPVVTVVVEPITGLTASNDSPTTVGDATNLMAAITTGSNVNFTWDFGDGTMGSGQNASHTYPDVGQYTAIVTAANPLGSVTAPTVVTITDVPISGLSASNNSPTNLGDPTTLTASVTDGTNVNFDWAFGDGTTGNGAVVNHTYPDVGQYTAVVTASNSVGELVATTNVTIEIDNWTIFLPVVLKADSGTQQATKTGPVSDERLTIFAANDIAIKPRWDVIMRS